MKIRKNKESGEYSYIGFGDQASLPCDICDTSNCYIKYATIIKDLKKQGILRRDYPLVCCFCYNLLGLVGRIQCTECGDQLSYSIVRIDKSTKIVTIRCPNRGHCIRADDNHYKIQKEYIIDIKEAYEYDPNTIIEEMIL